MHVYLNVYNKHKYIKPVLYSLAHNYVYYLYKHDTYRCAYIYTHVYIHRCFLVSL